MSIPKKIFFLLIAIVLNLFLVGGFLMIREKTMENNLRKEIKSLESYDLTTNRYNTKIKTKKDYAIVEKAIKEYLDSTAILMQDTLTIVKEPTLLNILSYQNYQEDSPDFTNSLSYLTEEKKNFNENISILLERLEEEKIKNYIETKTNKKNLRELYNELILSNSMKAYLEETKSLLEKNQERINEMIDTSSDILTLLKANKNSWLLEEGEIRFQKESLYKEYMKNLMKINK